MHSRPGASAEALAPSVAVSAAGTDHRVEAAGRLQPGRLLLAVAGAGSSADQLPEHSVAPAVLVDGALAILGVYEPPTAGRNPAMHIVGRPNDDLLDVILGHDADPEQAFIARSEHGLEETDGIEARRPGDEPTVSELWAGHCRSSVRCSWFGAVRPPPAFRAVWNSGATVIWGQCVMNVEGGPCRRSF